MRYSNHVQLTGLAIGDDGAVTEELAVLRVSTCECGQLVGSFAAHDAWHAKLDRVLDPSPGQVAEGRAAKAAGAPRRRGRTG